MTAAIDLQGRAARVRLAARGTTPTPSGRIHLVPPLIDTRSTFRSSTLEENPATPPPIGVEEDALYLRQRTNFGNRLDNADFVVGGRRWR